MTGSGTAADPYIISNATDLQAMQDDLDAYYQLGGAIDASGTAAWNANAGFIPIGTSAAKFTGHFDGRGYAISDLTIVRATTSYVGLFGYVNSTGYAIIDVGVTGSISGRNNVGGLCGLIIGGDIDNCYSTATVVGTNYSVGGLIGGINGTPTVSNCYSTGAVSNSGGSYYYVGGFCGLNYSSGTITKCYATGNVTASNTTEDVGGFIGKNQNGGTISKCYATGDVTGENDTGGFIGHNMGGAGGAATITDCYARGAVDGEDDVGGFVGQNGGVTGNSTITSCYSTGAVTSTGTKGGFCGYAYDANATSVNCFWDSTTSGEATSDGGTAKTTAEMKTKSTFTDADWDFGIVWYMPINHNDGYPDFLSLVHDGSIWIELANLHYIDAHGDERKLQGVATTADQQIISYLGF